VNSTKHLFQMNIHGLKSIRTFARLLTGKSGDSSRRASYIPCGDEFDLADKCCILYNITVV